MWWIGERNTEFKKEKTTKCENAKQKREHGTQYCIPPSGIPFGIEACSWLGDGTVHTDVNVMPFHLRKQCCYHDFFSPSSPAT